MPVKKRSKRKDGINDDLLFAIGFFLGIVMLNPEEIGKLVSWSRSVYDIYFRPYDRPEEVAVRHLLPIRTDPGHQSREKFEDERTGVRYIQRFKWCYECSALYARVSILWQTDGNVTYKNVSLQ